MLEISTGKSRSDTNWKPKLLEWDELVERLRRVRRTGETMAEYDRMTTADRHKVKDGPGFVGGTLQGGRRKKEAVTGRWLITLDADHATDDFLLDVDLILGGTAYVIYSTHSHRPAKPKYRLVVPVDREMSPDEYAAVSRKLAEQIGMPYWDKTTFEVHRLMYFPSCSNDAAPVLEVAPGEPLRVDGLLGQYADWRDPFQWPRHPGEAAERGGGKGKMEDPREKPGLVGAFCRVYTISAALEQFLPAVYEPAGDGRYTFVGATSSGGMVVYDDDTFAYSHHESDPISGREVNAFDLVRIHKFGSLDDKAAEGTAITKLPSYDAMLNLAAEDPWIKRERVAEALSEFGQAPAEEPEEPEEEGDPDAWMEQLDIDKQGNVMATAKNAELILRNGSFKNVLGYDAFGNAEVIKGRLPWRERQRKHEPYEPWLGADDKRLQHFLAKHYFSGNQLIMNAFTEVVHSNSFHPIKEYLEAQTWDGISRIETLFIDYLGAADTHYVRQATRKMLLAAIARLYKPGCKFDQMLVLIGPQGAGKSSLLAKLGRKWFSDSLRSFENKEAGEHLQAGWIFEIGELSALKKSEVEEVKAFLSKTEDRYRVAYDRQVSEFPRKCVFFGTTNTREFLIDATGNRRFWPIDINPKQAKHKHWEHLTDDMVGQIWAEALTLFRAGESLELDKEAREEAERQQAGHMEQDTREGIIQEWLDGLDGEEPKTRTCAAQIWEECFLRPKGTMRTWDAKEIVDLLRSLPEWEERPGKHRMKGYGVQRVFERVF